VDAFEFYSKLPRAVPGATSFTSAYLSTIKVRASDAILDLHCRTGERAVWVARSRGCKVIAIDEDERFCALVSERAEDGGSGNKIQTVASDYLDIPFEDQSFSLVMAEWVAVRTGLRRGLQSWKRLIPVGGFIAVSYPGVINKDAPLEVRGPLEQRMADPMCTLGEYHHLIKECGFEIVHQAPLDQELWENFYTDAVRRAWTLSANEAGRITTGPLTAMAQSNDIIREVLEEAHWYRHVGRGRVFLQSMLLRRTQ
jgi:arsenite methyltransferase